MKNAMKKLFSLALAAMLLVSVVPMGAMASEWLPDNSGDVSNAPGGIILDEPAAFKTEDPSAGDFGIYGEVPSESKSDADGSKNATGDVNVRVEVSLDGSRVYSDNHSYPANTTVKAVLTQCYPTYNADTHEVQYFKNGTKVAAEQTVEDYENDGVTDLKVEIVKKQIFVGVSVLGVTGSYKSTVPAGTVITLNEEFLKNCNLHLTSGMVIKRWKVGSDKYLDNGSKFTVNEAVEIVCEQVNPVDGSTPPTEGTTTPTADQITLQIKFGSNSKVSKTFTNTPDNGSATVANMLTYWYDRSWNDNFNCTKAWSKSQQTYIGVNGTAKAGDTVTVILETKGSKPTESTNPSTPAAEDIDVIVNVDGATKVNTSVKAKNASIDQLLKKLVGENWASVYKFDYWSEEGYPYKYANVNSVVSAGKKVTINLIGGTSKHNTNKVMLHVFLNGNTSAVYSSYNITGDLAQDYKVTYNEVKSFLLNKFKAKTDAGIDLDGLYYVTGNWVGNYFQDNKAKTIDGLDFELEKGYVHINVMLNNAVAKTSSNADSSNPKTGDDIYMTVTVMGLSAAALCAVYYISKKRAVR